MATKTKRTEHVGTPQRTAHGWQVVSASSDKVYSITQDYWGRWECDCDDFWYRRRRSGELCKHLAAVMAEELDEEEALVGD